MQPILGQWLLARKSFSLCDLGLVMGKDEISTATMDVVRRSKVSDRHRGVLNVPAWSAPAPRTVPRDLTRLLTLPKNKICRVLLQRVRIHPMNTQVFDPLSRQFTITRELCDIKVDVPVLHSISEAFLDQSLNLTNDLRNVIGSFCVQVDAVDSDVLHVLVE